MTNQATQTIPAGWTETTLGELVERKILYKPLDGNHGNIHPKSEDFVLQGVPFVMATDLKEGKLDLLNCKFITRKQANSLKKGFAINGDVLLSHKATLGRTALLKTRMDYVMLTPQITYYRVNDKSTLSNLFLKYYFDSPFFQKTLASYAGGGSTRDYIGITRQLDLPIILPLLPEQRGIAEVLSSLDDKIELLRKQNKTLENIAQTLFKRWFVDFEFPNEKGKPYKSSGGKMIGSTIENIPAGWIVKPLFDVADYINGGAFKDCDFSNNQQGLPVIRIAELKNGFTSQTNYTEKKLAPKYYLRNDDILFSWSGSPETSIDIFIWNKGEAVLNQHIFKVVPKDKKLKTWVFFLLKYHKPFFIHRAIQKQTTGLGHITVSDLKSHGIPFPKKEIIEKYDSIAEPLFQKIILNLHQLQTLSHLRDSLLPKLMKGEVRVKGFNN